MINVTRKMLHKDLQPLRIYALMLLSKYLCRYKWSSRLLNTLFSAKLKSGQPPKGITIEEHYLPSSDGEAQIRVKIYRPESMSGPLPAMLYTHGGGYIIGNPDAHDDLLAQFIDRRPCVIVAPAYRTAFVKRYPAAFDDCYMTLLWMRDKAPELGIDADKLMICGHSAGGGLTAAVTLKGRDTGDVNFAFQMPIYPMIDDQQPTDPERQINVVGWDTRCNAFGWESYLKDLHDRHADIPTYAAPARNSDYRDFPPTISFVGDSEPFYWETVDYIERLKQANVDVAFKVFDRCPHAAELLAPESSLGKECLQFTFDSYAEFYDKYVGA